MNNMNHIKLYYIASNFKNTLEYQQVHSVHQSNEASYFTLHHRLKCYLHSLRFRGLKENMCFQQILQFFRESASA